MGRRMKFNIATNILPFHRRPGSLLVCETDGFTLRAAVISRSGDTLTASFVAKSQAQDFKKAVAEVVSNLKVQGWKGGGKAVLLMPGVVTALIELPVMPSKPRAAMQMQELVRWELEPLLMQHTTVWSVGRILVGLGYLEESQAREVFARQQGKYEGKENEIKLKMYSLKRFGDIAIEQGYITREQLDEALAKQAWLRMDGDEIACGWQAISSDVDTQGSYPWLASGVNKSLLKQWQDAFTAQRASLDYLFPAAGCSVANLSQNAPAIVLEVGGGQVVGMRLGEDGIEAIVTHESSLNGAMEACLETYHGLTPPDPEVLFLAVDDVAGIGLAKTLAEVVGRKVIVLQGEISGVADSVTSGMAGAARHAFGMAGSKYCCAVSTRGPNVPWTSLPEFRLAAGGGLIVAAIVLAEVILQVRQSIAETAAERVSKQAAELDAAVASVQALVKQHNDIKAKIKEAENAELKMAFYTEELPRRTKMVTSLLAVFERATNDQVVLDSVAEEPGKGVVVSAWALSDTAAQQFVLTMKHSLELHGLAVVDARVLEKIGRLSLPGYGVTFQIVDKAVATKLATATPAGSKPK